jgi:hypothetical protein
MLTGTPTHFENTKLYQEIKIPSLYIRDSKSKYGK